MKDINTVNFSGKKVLIRVDFNVPLDENFNIIDTNRIQATKPTIDKVLKDGASVILLSHLGRPKQKDIKYSLEHIRDKVSQILGQPIEFAKDCIGTEAEEKASKLEAGEILLLENLRFHKEEEAGDVDFSKKLALLGDVYINDAFGTVHRAHASTTIIAQFFPNDKYFGLLLAKEIESIEKVVKNNQKPVVAILGGAKISSKITIIENILDKVDHLIIGGGMTFTFIKAMGGKIGNSICEDDKLYLAKEILIKTKEKNVCIHLPIDVVVANKFSNQADIQTTNVNDIPEGWQGLDVGEKTLKDIENIILKAKTILWNGPVGVFEMEKFSNGTRQIGNYIAKATHNGAFSLVGGGDSVAAVKQFDLEHKISYVSTGGGAMLEMLEGKTLPGVKAIID